MGAEYGNRNDVFLVVPGCPSSLLGRRFRSFVVCWFPRKLVGVAVVVAVVVNVKGRTRADLFVVVLFGPSRAQNSSIVLVGVGHCSCLFVLVVALDMSAVIRLDV